MPALEVTIDGIQHAHHRGIDVRVGLERLAPLGKLTAESGGWGWLDTHA